jgi:hypothetical protein
MERVRDVKKKVVIKDRVKLLDRTVGEYRKKYLS